MLLILGLGLVLFFTFYIFFKAFYGSQRALAIPVLLLVGALGRRNRNQGSQRGKIFLLWSQNHVEDSQQTLNPCNTRWFWWDSCCLNHIFQKICNLQVTTAGFAALGVVPWQGEDLFQMSFALRFSVQGRAGQGNSLQSITKQSQSTLPLKKINCQVLQALARSFSADKRKGKIGWFWLLRCHKRICSIC